MMNKKAQGLVIAGFIILMLLIILGYLFFLPFSEKCKIIPDLPECSNLPAESSGEVGNIQNAALSLLSEKPGLLVPVKDSAEYDLGTVNLFNNEEAEIPIRISTNSIEKSWFGGRVINQQFSIPGEAREATIFLGIAESSGFSSVIVKINDKVVDKVSGEGIHIIQIPSSMLGRDNVLRLETTTPVLPFMTSRVKLSTIIVKETYGLIQSELERNFALVYDMADIQSATLSFDADCYSDDSLIVRLNNYTVANERVCSEYKNEISGFLQKDNVIRFSTKGTFFVHDLKIKIKAQESDYPTYFFALSKENYDKIKDGRFLVMLRLGFSDKTNKKLTVLVNGNAVTINTDKLIYETAISRLLLKGQNSVKLIPEKTVNLGSIDIYSN